MDGYNEFVLAQVIANQLDREYDDGREVFTDAKVVNGFQVIVKVTDAMDDSERTYIVTVAEGE